MRHIAALIQQLRKLAPGGTSYVPWLVDGGAGASAFGSYQPIHATVKVCKQKLFVTQELLNLRLAPMGAVARPPNANPCTHNKGVRSHNIECCLQPFEQPPVELDFGHCIWAPPQIDELP